MNSIHLVRIFNQNSIDILQLGESPLLHFSLTNACHPKRFQLDPSIFKYGLQTFPCFIDSA
jgi:hypothetical protein